MGRLVSPASVWRPPLLTRTPADAGRVPGALYGSLLYDQPAHVVARDTLVAFAAPDPRPLRVEVGFDHGMCLLDHARRWPEVRWLGFELRERRVEAVRRHAPPNCLPWRGDVRAAFAGLLPEGCVDRVDVLFPDPVWVESRRARHLLFTPVFVAILQRVLRSPGEGGPVGGIVHVATDVEGYFRWIEGLFVEWRAVEAPAMGPVLSRRERICRRDGAPVWRGAWAPPLG